MKAVVSLGSPSVRLKVEGGPHVRARTQAFQYKDPKCSYKRRSNLSVRMTSQQQEPALSKDGKHGTRGAMTYTSYEGNAWRCELASSGVKILVDPWLEGDLVFGGLDFFFKGTKRVTKPETLNIDQIAKETDFILLTMGIDDHTHRPTLKRLPKSIPVVGSPSAAAVARELGYSTVLELRHGSGQVLTMCDGKIRIQATEGALVGPPWSVRENGYVITETTPGGVKLYYEPHADYVPSSVASVGKVDIVVSPPCTQSLLGYQLVKGATDNVPLLKLLQPKAVVAFMNAEFDASGPLHTLLSETGSPEALERQLKESKELSQVEVVVPKAGEPVKVL